MAISRASTRNRLAAALAVTATAVATIAVAAAPLPASYAGPCTKSEEFVFAQRALAQAKRDVAAGHYSAASQTLEKGIEKLDRYATARSFAAGFPVLDDTGQHLSLTYFYEIHANLKKAVYLKNMYLGVAIEACRTEPKIISDKLRRLSGH